MPLQMQGARRESFFFLEAIDRLAHGPRLVRVERAMRPQDAVGLVSRYRRG